ncbi:MAG: thiamine-phosphate kinase [Campylobacterota bacterium]|nr:thiamine-phosphate kinase [Campylobacterota bacterium]
MNLENYFISQFNNPHIGDDGALIGSYVYSKDAFFENVHFKTSWMTHYQIAQKSMLVNISDAIAMNADPLYALLSVAMPKNITKSQMQELSRGFQDTANRYNVEIIGGDTISNLKLDISVTIISKTKQVLKRSGLKKDFLIAYTGNLGNSKKDLRTLMNLGKLHKNSKFTNINLRDRFIKKSQRFLSSGMDISDGLFSDLGKLADVNNIGFKFNTKISKQVGCSGEEYEMLVAFSKRDRKTILRRSAQSRTKLTIFATSIRKKYTNRCKAHHF